MGALKLPQVAAAFLAVPRHHFLPDRPLEEVYTDQAIPTKFQNGLAISSSSQPAIMAIMLEQLGLAPGQRVLEIGAGTGYNAALLGYLVGAAGRVVSVDIDADLVEAAAAGLARAGSANVEVVCADGGYGCESGAPYDRIILTVGAWDIAPAWVEQLAPGGRLVLPLDLGSGEQKSIAFEKPASTGPGGMLLASLSVADCGFMRLRGVFAGPDQAVPLDSEAKVQVAVAGNLPVSPSALHAWLSGPVEDFATGIRVSMADFWDGLAMWLGLHAPGFCHLIASGDGVEQRRVPPLITFQSTLEQRLTVGLVAPEGMCAVREAPQPVAEREAFELAVRAWGPGPLAPLAQRLIAQVQAWGAAGRPGSQGLRVRVYARDAPHVAAEGEIVVEKRSTRLVMTLAAQPPG